MPHKVTYDSKRNCIVTRIDGKLDIPVLKEFLAEIARVISTSGCKRILDDLRGAELIKTNLEGANLTRAKLWRRSLKDAKYSAVDLNKADFSSRIEYSEEEYIDAMDRTLPGCYEQGKRR